MRIYRIASSYLKNYAEIKTNFPDADLWVIRKGSLETVGKPVNDFSPEHIGIKVIDKEALLPSFLYYALESVYASGYFKRLANGTTNLVHIRAQDVADIPLR